MYIEDLLRLREEEVKALRKEVIKLEQENIRLNIKLNYENRND
jgi:hypothetical protein|tara:strand:- start:252 stop:380 length:129 start_codon:yes stop_codon:yes gene_type:complete